MCVYSMVSGHFQEKWPSPQDYPVAQKLIPWAEYQELIRKAKLYDERFNQQECPDPKKVEWEKSMEEFLKKRGLLK